MLLTSLLTWIILESQHWTFYASNSLTIMSFKTYVCNLCKKYGQQQLQMILVIWHISLRTWFTSLCSSVSWTLILCNSCTKNLVFVCWHFNLYNWCTIFFFLLHEIFVFVFNALTSMFLYFVILVHVPNALTYVVL